MEKNPDIGRGKGNLGSSKEEMRKAWEQFAEDLNKMGPPMRTGAEWQRVWIHYKASVKKKLSQNKRSIFQTGGGEYEQIPLNHIEKRVADLIHTNLCIDPEGAHFGVEEYGHEEAETHDVVENNEDRLEEEEIDNNIRLEASPLKTRKSRSKGKTNSDDRLDLLKKQTLLMEEQNKTLKSIEKTRYKEYLIKKRQFNMEKELFSLKKKYSRENLS